MSMSQQFQTIQVPRVQNLAPKKYDKNGGLHYAIKWWESKIAPDVFVCLFIFDPFSHPPTVPVSVDPLPADRVVVVVAKAINLVSNVKFPNLTSQSNWRIKAWKPNTAATHRSGSMWKLVTESLLSSVTHTVHGVDGILPNERQSGQLIRNTPIGETSF